MKNKLFFSDAGVAKVTYAVMSILSMYVYNFDIIFSMHFFGSDTFFSSVRQYQYRPFCFLLHIHIHC